jgi:serine/threonine protein phosphatase PrpC
MKSAMSSFTWLPILNVDKNTSTLIFGIFDGHGGAY